MEMLLGIIVLLACLVFGVRHGGIGLAVISGIGLVIYTFVFGYKPGNPPIDVMLTRSWQSSLVQASCRLQADLPSC